MPKFQFQAEGTSHKISMEIYTENHDFSSEISFIFHPKSIIIGVEKILKENSQIKRRDTQ